LLERPDDVVALNNLAWVYAEAHNPKAITYARRAFTMRPSIETGETLGWALTQNGQAKSAVTLMTQAAQALPNDPTVQYHYAVNLKLNGRKGEALSLAQRVAEQPTTFPEQDAARRLVMELRNGN
jgi:Flp pilus assembly protein TadD